LAQAFGSRSRNVRGQQAMSFLASLGWKTAPGGQFVVGNACGRSAAEAALEAWAGCNPKGYVVDERNVWEQLPLVASCVPNRSPGARAKELGELFGSHSDQRPSVFLKLLQARNGQVHFLYFWKAFGEATRMAQAGLAQGLLSEVETLRDALVRRLKEPVCDSEKDCPPGSGKSFAASISTALFLSEVCRAGPMSAYPRFWQLATEPLSGYLEAEEISLEELTSVLLAFLQEAVLWEHGGRATDISPVPLSSPSIARKTDQGIPVHLHIYDVSKHEHIQKLNRILAHKSSPLKLGGVFHTGVEVNGLEWSFGLTMHDNTGVCCSKPKSHWQHHYRQTVLLRSTGVPEEEIACIVTRLIEEYPGHGYNLLRRNCCHFADDFCRRLGVGGIPGWVHRLARLGARVDEMLKRANIVED